MKSHPPLFILRHGETEWNAQDRLQGRFDSPLTAQGVQQARDQHEILRPYDLSGVAAFCSPQGRAFHTASIALRGLVPAIETRDALREIGLGEWAGRHRSELKPYLPEGSDGFAVYPAAPQGEGFAVLHARCAAFLSQLNRPAVLVTHGITSRMLRLILLGRGIADLPDMQGGQGVVFHIENGQQKRLTKGG